MSLSHAYGTPPDSAAASALLHRGLDLGYTHLDTAALYGFGANESLIGRTLHGRRHEFVLASKGGMFRDAQGKREIDGRPATVKRHCEESLTRLQTDVIDCITCTGGTSASRLRTASVRWASSCRRARSGPSVSVKSPRPRSARRTPSIRSPRYKLNTPSGRAMPRSPYSRRAATRHHVRRVQPAGAWLSGRRASETSPRFPRRTSGSRCRASRAHTFAQTCTLLDGLAEIARDAGATMAQLVLAWVLARGDAHRCDSGDHATRSSRGELAARRYLG